MNKGQTKIGLILLAIIAIIAVVGLILMFIKPGATQLGIGDIYGPERGIVTTVPIPPYQPGGPAPQFPAAPTGTIGTRTPAMIFFRGEYANIAEMSKCWSDLAFEMLAPQDAFSCYVLPTTGPAYEVTGFFWPSTAALPRPLYDLGGDIYCYERSPYDRDALISRLKGILAKKGWGTDTINNKEVLVCSKGATFLFPQGLPPGYGYYR
jgi:hypothetical protein